MFMLWVAFIWRNIVYKVIKSVNEWNAVMDVRGFGTKDFSPLFFFMYVDILWQKQKKFL